MFFLDKKGFEGYDSIELNNDSLLPRVRVLVYRKTEKVKTKLDQRAQEIVRAARALLADKSYHGASIKLIAKQAGIATGTFYLYFRNKEALFNAIVDEMYEDLLQAIITERSKYTNTLDKLQASMRAAIELFVKEQQLAKIFLVQIPSANTVFNDILVYFEDELIQLTKNDLDEAVEEGLLEPQDTLVSAIAFVGTFREVILRWLRQGEPEDLLQAFDTLVAYNMRGLGAHSSTTNS